MSDLVRMASQARWKSDEVAEGLTWGRRMTGDSLWDIYQAHKVFRATDRLLEIGPGYGRLLQTALDRKIKFLSYVGIDLSEARVARLSSDFGTDCIRFEKGDIDTWNGTTRFDAVICSSTFEHLYPDFSAALRNIAIQMADHGVALIDFIHCQENSQHVEEETGTFIGQYEPADLKRRFEACGFVVRAIEDCLLGEGTHGPVQRRVVVAELA